MHRLLPTCSLLALGLLGCNILIVDEDRYKEAVAPYEDFDGDGFTPSEGDCDDAAVAIHPGADEVCGDYIDNDCNGEIDEDSAIDASTWYADTDSDGFGDDRASTLACTTPSGYTADNKDCDDNNAQANPSADELCNGIDDNCDGSVDETDAVDVSTWYADTDGDGFGDPDSGVQACTAPSGHVADSTDCDDNNAQTNTSADELCNGIDDNCDDSVDESDAADVSTWYADTDGDGFGDANASTQSCAAPSGHVADSTDCNDAAATAYPGATEVCGDSLDNDCNGTADAADAADASTWYPDADTDGYGDTSNPGTLACTAPSGHVADNTDCNDAAATAFPGGTEICGDNLDNDCNGTADGGDATDATTWYPDTDTDGFGDETDPGTLACTAPSGLIADNTDCNDSNGNIHPNATETCDNNNPDEDCNGVSDNDDAGATNQSDFYLDTDGDGFGSNNVTRACDLANGLSQTADDCNDNNTNIHPGADEYCDGTDNDCDGTTDEDDAVDAIARYPDFDGDGYGQTSGMTTSCGAINSVPLSDSGTSSPSAVISYYTTAIDSIELTNCESALSVSVDVNITHDYRGDLEITLSNPAGTELSLWDGRGDSQHGLVATFADNASSPLSDDTSGPLGEILPSEPLSQFSGEAATGQWTLTVEDTHELDHGTLNSWGLDISCAASSLVANDGDCDETNDAVHPGAAEVFGDSLDNDCDGTVDNLEFVEVDTSAWSPSGVYGPRVSARSEGIYLAWATDSYQDGGTTFYNGAIVSLYDGADLAAGPTDEFTIKDSSNTGTMGSAFDFAVDDTYLYLVKSVHGGSGSTLNIDTLLKANPTQQGGSQSSEILGNQPYEDVDFFLGEDYNGNEYAIAVGCGADGLETILGGTGAIHYDSSSTYKTAIYNHSPSVCAPALLPYSSSPFFISYFHIYEPGMSYGYQYTLYSSLNVYTYSHSASTDAYDIEHWRNNSYRVSAYATSQNGANLRVERTGEDASIYSGVSHEISATEDLEHIDIDVSTSGTVYVCGIGATGYSVWVYSSMSVPALRLPKSRWILRAEPPPMTSAVSPSATRIS